MPPVAHYPDYGQIVRGNYLKIPQIPLINFLYMDYLKGKENKAIRYYFYCQRGLGVINDFRNVAFLIFAGYFALKLDNILWMGAMFLGSLPFLILIGWYSVHRMGNVIDWLNIKFSTHYGIRQFTLQEEILEELKTINKKTPLK